MINNFTEDGSLNKKKQMILLDFVNMSYNSLCKLDARYKFLEKNDSFFGTVRKTTG